MSRFGQTATFRNTSTSNGNSYRFNDDELELLARAYHGLGSQKGEQYYAKRSGYSAELFEMLRRTPNDPSVLERWYAARREVVPLSEFAALQDYLSRYSADLDNSAQVSVDESNPRYLAAVNGDDKDSLRLASSIIYHLAPTGVVPLVYFRGEFWCYSKQHASWIMLPGFAEVQLMGLLNKEVQRTYERSLDLYNEQLQELQLQMDGADGNLLKMLKAKERELTKPKRLDAATLQKNVRAQLPHLVSIAERRGELLEPGIPLWLEEQPGDPDSGYILVTKNCMLDLSQESLAQIETYADLPKLRTLPSDPRYFSDYAMGHVEFNPHAPDVAPNLDKLTSKQWSGDHESVDLFYEFAGHVPVTKYEYKKAYLGIGVSDSGKSSLKEAIAELIGRKYVFEAEGKLLIKSTGTSAFEGKRLITMSDLRQDGSAEDKAVMDTVLRWLGPDSPSIEPKYRQAFNVTNKPKFMFLSNFMPSFPAEESEAMRNRVVCPGRCDVSIPLAEQDPELIAKIRDHELTVFLNRAIVGLARLVRRGHFQQPKSGADLRDDIAPIAGSFRDFVNNNLIVTTNEAFSSSKPDDDKLEELKKLIGNVDDYLNLHWTAEEIGKRQDSKRLDPSIIPVAKVEPLFRLYRAWAARANVKYPFNQQTFGKNLHSAVREHRVKVCYVRNSDPRSHGKKIDAYYMGVAIDKTTELYKSHKSILSRMGLIDDNS